MMKPLFVFFLLELALSVAGQHSFCTVEDYHVLDHDEWYTDHLYDVDCFESPFDVNITSPRDLLFCPIPNPYSPSDPLYVKIGSTCDPDGNICCLVDEYDCPGGELYCAMCEDCRFPQMIHGSCCGVEEQKCNEETEVCCKCGFNTYRCIPSDEPCRECDEEENEDMFAFAPRSTPWESTTTPTPIHHEEL